MSSLADVTPSVWVATAADSAYPALEGTVDADVVVIGGGITGLTTALLSLREGMDVVLVEADRICMSTTGYSTAKLTSLHALTYSSIAEEHGDDAARIYGQANQAAIEKVAGLVKAEGIDCDFERTPAYTYTEDPEQLDAINKEVEVARRLGLPASFVAQTSLPFEIAGAVRFIGQAQFHPRKYCLALAAIFQREGGRIFERSAATNITDGEPHIVETAGGSIRAAHVVQATQLPFQDPFGFFTSNYPHQSYGIAVRFDDPDLRGMYLSAGSPTRSVRPLRTGGKSYLIVGGEGHKVARETDTAERYRALETWAAERFGTGTPEYRWSAHDYLPVDGIPYIGKLSPDSEGMWLATGFKKWGLSNGTVAAMILTDLMIGKENPWAPTFDSTRLKPKASAKRMLERQAEQEQQSDAPPVTVFLPDIRTLAAGEGRVFRQDGHKVAAYRDPDGNVQALSAVCTHMACDVAFNAGERTWDCPCHGSRFKTDGTVVHGPAVRPLHRITLAEEPPQA